MVLKRHTEEARRFLQGTPSRFGEEVVRDVAALIEQVEARTWEEAAKVCDQRAKADHECGWEGDALAAIDCAAALRAAAKEEG